jgi:hypothetical protein
MEKNIPIIIGELKFRQAAAVSDTIMAGAGLYLRVSGVWDIKPVG